MTSAIESTQFIIHMQLEKETKGTFRFEEITKVKGSDNWIPVAVEDGALIGTLYVRKSQLGGQKPTRLKLTIDAT